MTKIYQKGKNIQKEHTGSRINNCYLGTVQYTKHTENYKNVDRVQGWHFTLSSWSWMLKEHFSVHLLYFKK
jgi:hypothetical protein